MKQTGTRGKPAQRDKVGVARGGSKPAAHGPGVNGAAVTMSGASSGAAAASGVAHANGAGGHGGGRGATVASPALLNRSAAVKTGGGPGILARGTAVSTGESLEQSVFRSLEQYFNDLDGAKPHALHEMVLGAIEKPLLQFALHRCAGNQSAAADLLGINRNTLRRKLQDYGLH